VSLTPASPAPATRRPLTPAEPTRISADAEIRNILLLLILVAVIVGDILQYCSSPRTEGKYRDPKPQPPSQVTPERRSKHVAICPTAAQRAGEAGELPRDYSNQLPLLAALVAQA
jgi:hypothetical protein